MPIARDRERHSPRCAQHTSHLTCSHLLVSALRLPGILLLSLSLSFVNSWKKMAQMMF